MSWYWIIIIFWLLISYGYYDWRSRNPEEYLQGIKEKAARKAELKRERREQSRKNRWFDYLVVVAGGACLFAAWMGWLH